jgi:hypothetical protein
MWEEKTFEGEDVRVVLSDRKVPLASINRWLRNIEVLVDTSGFRSQQIYYPCIDDSEGKSVKDLFKICDTIVNGTEIAKRDFSEVISNEIGNKKISDFQLPKNMWNCDIDFAASPALSHRGGDNKEVTGVVASNISSHFEDVWNDYLKRNTLSKVSLLIVGFPKSGKTELAKIVASK